MQVSFACAVIFLIALCAGQFVVAAIIGGGGLLNLIVANHLRKY